MIITVISKTARYFCYIERKLLLDNRTPNNHHIILVVKFETNDLFSFQARLEVEIYVEGNELRAECDLI